jgi:hypothetical protein
MSASHYICLSCRRKKEEGGEAKGLLCQLSHPTIKGIFLEEIRCDLGLGTPRESGECNLLAEVIRGLL